MKLTKISIEGVTFEQEGDRNFTNFWCAGGDKVIRYSKSFHSRKNQYNLPSSAINDYFREISQ